MTLFYTKLFTTITDSTIWSEPNHVRICWVTMLAMSDQHGEILASIPGLAHRARITLEEAQDSLEKFLSPDAFSRTPDNEGRRIEEIEGGWRLLNHKKYRDVRDEEERKEQLREAQRRFREKSRNHCVITCNQNNHSKPQSSHTDTDTDTDTEEKSSPVGAAAKPKKESKKVSDEEFFAALKLNQGYAGIDIDRELARMDAWLLTRPSKQKTRRFIVNWLNRCDHRLPPQTPGAAANTW